MHNSSNISNKILLIGRLKGRYSVNQRHCPKVRGNILPLEQDSVLFFLLFLQLQRTQLRDWPHVILPRCSDADNPDFPFRSRKHFFNTTQRPTPSWAAWIHHQDHITRSNVTFFLDPFVSGVQSRKVFLHPSFPILGDEILYEPPAISGV